MSNNKQVKLTLVRSKSGRKPKHLATLECLGLNRMHQTVVKHDNPCIRGMINQVDYLLQVEEVN